MEFACLRWVSLEEGAAVLHLSARTLREHTGPTAKPRAPCRDRQGRREIQTGPVFAWLNQHTRCRGLVKPPDYDAWHAALATVEPQTKAPELCAMMLRLQAVMLQRLATVPLVDALATVRGAVELEAEALRGMGHTEDEEGEWYKCLRWIPLEGAAAVLGVSVRLLRKHTAPEASPRLPCRDRQAGREVQTGPAVAWLDEHMRCGSTLREPPDFDEWNGALVFPPPGYVPSPDAEAPIPLRTIFGATPDVAAMLSRLQTVLLHKLKCWPALAGLRELQRFVDRELEVCRAPRSAGARIGGAARLEICGKTARSFPSRLLAKVITESL